MAYYIISNHSSDPIIKGYIYSDGNGKWSRNINLRKEYATEALAQADIDSDVVKKDTNPDGVSIVNIDT